MAQQQQISASEGTLNKSQTEIQTREYKDCFFYMGKKKFLTQRGCIFQVMPYGSTQNIELVKYRYPDPVLNQWENEKSKPIVIKDTDKLREIERKVAESETMYIKGEFFPECTEIITEAHAWDRILNSGDFLLEYCKRIHTKDSDDWKKGDTEVTRKEAWEAVATEWMKSGINNFDKHHLRSDGMVEVEKYDYPMSREERQRYMKMSSRERQRYMKKRSAGVGRKI